MKGLLPVAAALVACGSSNSGPAGGPVAGAQDSHCSLADGGTRVQPVNFASCNLASADAGTFVAYGPTMHNSEADDDDCKYHLKFSSNPVYENSDVTFNVVATLKATGQPATASNMIAEVYLNTMHPAPNTNQNTVENPPGTFAVGPVRFDAKGQWTVRFHLHEECGDATADSPHGHAAFYIEVP